MLRRTALAALICLALGLPAAAVAADGTSPQQTSNSHEAVPLPHIQVTAVSSNLKWDIPATVTTIDRQQMDRMLVADIRDLVRYEPGVSVIGSAGRFGLDSFNIRGLSGNRSRIEIDGVSMPPSFGAAVAGSSVRAGRDYIDLDTIASVDIIRGPVSAMYPSDALGGVVSLRTKDPQDYLDKDKSLYGAVKEQYSSKDRSLGSSVTLAGGNTHDAVMFVLNHSEGHETGNKGDTGGSGSARTRPDPMRYDSDDLLGKYVHRADSGRTDRVILDVSDRRTRSNSLSEESSSVDYYRSQDLNRRARLSVGQSYTHLDSALADRADWTAYWQHSHSRTRTQTDNATTYRYYDSEPLDETVVGGKLSLLKQIDSGSVDQAISYGISASQTRPSARVGGYGVNKISGESGSSSDYMPGNYPLHLMPKSHTDRYALFGQDKISLFDGKLEITPGARAERYAYKPKPDALYYASFNGAIEPESYEENHVSPKLGLMYRLNDVLSAYADYAYGYRPPLYSEISGSWSEQPFAGMLIAFLPNNHLKAETSRNLEIGLRGRGELGWFNIDAYYNRYRNFIWSGHQLSASEVPSWAAQISPNAYLTYFYQSVNTRKAVIKGAEASGALRMGALSDTLSGWNLRWSASIASGKLIEPGDTAYSPLNTVDPAKLVIGISYDTPNWGGELIGTGVRRHTRLDDDSDFRPSGYGLLDAYAHWQARPGLTLYAGIENLTDRKYWDWGNLNGGTLGNLISGNGLNDAGTGGVPADRLSMPGRSFSLAVRWSF